MHTTSVKEQRNIYESETERAKRTKAGARWKEETRRTDRENHIVCKQNNVGEVENGVWLWAIFHNS